MGGVWQWVRGRINRRVVLAVGLLVVLVVLALLLPIPGAAQLRTWAQDARPAAAIVLFLAYALITVAPVPRTVFTIACGLLLGPVTGIVVAISAATVSALLGFALARSVGRGLVARHLDKTAVRVVNERLADGGWLAVASLRLIPVVPFTPLNYCCGVLSVRLRPYLIGSVVGSLPGTMATVVLVNSVIGNGSPLSLLISAGCAVLGATGLVIAIRRARPTQRPAEPETAPVTVAADAE